METGGAMKNLLICIATHFIWFFEKYNFRIVDSSFDPSFGGQGLITLKNTKITVCLVSDRDKIFIEFSPLKGWEDHDGVTLDLIHQHILGKSIDTTMVTDETIKFLKDHFDSITTLFCDNDTEKLKSIFSKLKKERAKRLFG